MVRRYVGLDDAHFLDIGCGLGAYVNRISDFTDHTFGVDIDAARVAEGASKGVRGLSSAISESLPFADASFDGILLNEVIEHVNDDRATILEALRVTKPGGRVIIFAPNRFYPFETHGVYLGKRYVFGNIPLVNYLPNPLRARLVPHARAYTRSGLKQLTAGLPGKWVDWKVVYPGFDNVVARKEVLGRALQKITYALERTWFERMGLSHLLVLERV